MRRFITKLLAYALVCGALFIAADWLLSRWMRKAHHPNIEIWNDVMEGHVDADVIALGSSKANTSFLPQIADSILGTRSWNLGVLGHHFQAEMLRYEMLCRFDREPNMVVQFLDPLFFMAGRNFDKVQFYPWFWNRIFLKSLNEYFGTRFVLENSIPFVRYHSFLPWEVSAKVKRTEKGFHSYKSELKRPFSPQRKEHFYREENLPDMFAKFIEELKRKGIDVVIVRPPEYESIVYGEGDEEAMLSYIDSITRITGTPFLDFSKMDICSDSTYFIDAWHLNEKGAIVFTDTLSNEIRHLELNRRK